MMNDPQLGFDPKSVCMAIIDYTNWKGRRSERPVVLRGISHGATKWHLEQQWLLIAHCLEDGVVKEFSLQNVHGWRRMTSEEVGKVDWKKK